MIAKLKRLICAGAGVIIGAAAMALGALLLMIPAVVFVGLIALFASLFQ